jgi:hypothetical protein
MHAVLFLISAAVQHNCRRVPQPLAAAHAAAFSLCPKKGAMVASTKRLKLSRSTYPCTFGPLRVDSHSNSPALPIAVTLPFLVERPLGGLNGKVDCSLCLSFGGPVIPSGLGIFSVMGLAADVM